MGSHANLHPLRYIYIYITFLKVFLNVFHFNTKLSICTTIPKEQNMGIQSLCFDVQCLLLFHGLQMLIISTLHISQLFNKNLFFGQKKTLVSLHKLCLRSWIIYLSQIGPSLISHFISLFVL